MGSDWSVGSRSRTQWKGSRDTLGRVVSKLMQRVRQHEGALQSGCREDVPLPAAPKGPLQQDLLFECYSSQCFCKLKLNQESHIVLKT